MATLRRVAATAIGIGLAITGMLGSGTAFAVAADGAPEQAPLVRSTAQLVAPGSGSWHLEQRRQALAARVGVRSEAVSCWSNVIIYANANGRYVSTERGYGGDSANMLRARATAIGPWELYYTSRAPRRGWTTMYANANNRYVSAEIGYGGDYNGMLRARATAIGPWEWYYW
jgi:hypothetical protein